jgi:hypothetical protein
VSGSVATPLHPATPFAYATGERSTSIPTPETQSNAPAPSLIEGPSNTAVGINALASNTTGILNSAVGVDALADNTTGRHNTSLAPMR